jgi:hypothetical protein
VERLVFRIRSQQIPVPNFGSKIDFSERGFSDFPHPRQMLGYCITTGDDRFFKTLPNSIFAITSHWTTQLMIVVKQIKNSYY